MVVVLELVVMVRVRVGDGSGGGRMGEGAGAGPGGLMWSCGVASRTCHPGRLLQGDQSKRLVIELWPPLTRRAPEKNLRTGALCGHRGPSADCGPYHLKGDAYYPYLNII